MCATEHFGGGSHFEMILRKNVCAKCTSALFKFCASSLCKRSYLLNCDSIHFINHNTTHKPPLSFRSPFICLNLLRLHLICKRLLKLMSPSNTGDIYRCFSPPHRCWNAKVFICSNYFKFVLRFKPKSCRLCKMETPVLFFSICFLSAGEFGVYLPDHFHPRVLFEDSGIWLSVPRRRLFTELLEHIGLCHRLHGVRWDLSCRWIPLPAKDREPHPRHVFNCWKLTLCSFSYAYNLLLQSLHFCLGYHQQDSRRSHGEGWRVWHEGTESLQSAATLASGLWSS